MVCQSRLVRLNAMRDWLELTSITKIVVLSWFGELLLPGLFKGVLEFQHPLLDILYRQKAISYLALSSMLLSVH